MISLSPSLRRKLRKLPAKRLERLLEDVKARRIANAGPLGGVKLHARQLDFLSLTCEEALFGGAAGGGKSYCLLSWLAEGILIPEYSGLFLRRTFAQLEKSNDSAIVKSMELYHPMGGKYNSSKHRWHFPSGATIEFGHMQHQASMLNYQGGAYHRVAYDEVTQFTEEQYTYLFSRMRMKKHFPVSMGVRAAANPGGVGHQWVKTRFVTPEAEKMIAGLDAREPSPRDVFWATDKRAFVPSRVADNPSLDIEDYIERMLLHLPPVLRMQLVNGDWSAVEGAMITVDQLRYFTMRGEMLVPMDAEGQGLRNCTINAGSCQRFATIDTAGTSKQKAAEDKGKPASWSVCMVWDYWPGLHHLYLRHVWRDRVGWLKLTEGVKRTLEAWRVKLAVIENAHYGEPLGKSLAGVANVQMVNPMIAGMKQARSGEVKAAKLERAVASGLFGMLERCELYLPDVQTVKGAAAWLPQLETEILSWTGRPEETADQIDTLSYGAHHIGEHGIAWGGVIHN